MKADLNEVKLTSKGTIAEKVGIFSKARSNVSEIDSSLLGWVLEVGSAIAAKTSSDGNEVKCQSGFSSL